MNNQDITNKNDEKVLYIIKSILKTQKRMIEEIIETQKVLQMIYDRDKLKYPYI